MTVAGMLLSYGGSALDDYFEYVTMLLPGNGTNGAQNNTFLDSSTNNFTITRNGNTTQGTFSPYGSNWSNYFNGSTTYLSVANNTALQFGTGDFTIECWVYLTSYASGTAGIASKRSGAAVDGTWQIDFAANTGNARYQILNSTGGIVTVSIGTVALGTWTHIAVSKQSGTTRTYINGVAGGTTATATSIDGSTNALNIGTGDSSGSTNFLNGYISNFRIVKGTAVYTSAFTPSTTPLTAITNTSLLTCQSNRFIDTSANAFAITVNSTPSVQRFSPFSPSAAYSTSTNGGSGYFDGATDGLTAANNTALQLGSTYTAEAWVYPLAYGGNLRVWSDGSNDPSNVDLYVTSGGTVGLAGGSATVSGYTLPLNSWTHIAVVVNAGTLSVYINGTSRTLAGTTTGYNSTSTATRYFGSFSAAGYDWNGYISNIRFVKGTAVYTSTFTPPTSPLTAISGTSILLNMQNAAVIDNAMMNDLETVGNAQISTTQSKFGGSSMYFDGTGDWLYGSSTLNVGFGTGPFTVEMWVYPTTNPANGPGTLFDARSGTNAEGWVLRIFSDLSVGFYDGPSNLYQQTAANAVSLNTWAYLAFVRSGTTLTIYVNGVSAKTATVSSNLGSSWPYYVGNNYAAGYTYYGYIDDLRITKGYARYTANFTPPSSAFPTS